MGHEDAQTVAFPGEAGGKVGSDFRSVDVAIDASDGFEGSESVEDFGWAEVARVPEFVACGEVGKDGFVEEAVSVGEQTDSQVSIMYAK